MNQNHNRQPRGPLAKAILDNIDKDKVKTRRRNFDDRGRNTLDDRYNKEELYKINNFFITEKNNPLGCRDRLCFLISHAMLCRSQTTLSMEFADLFSLEIENQGLTQCIALIATIAFGKTNQHGKIEYESVVRHRNIELCPVGALASCFENEEFLDFTRRSNWYEIKLFKGEDKFTSITYKVQHKIYTQVFKKIGFTPQK